MIRFAMTALCVAALLGPSMAQDDEKRRRAEISDREWIDSTYGRATYNVPVATSDGDWEGTWFYANRDAKWMLWIRREEGELQFRMRFLNLAARETFETEWNGIGSYQRPPAEGSFALDVDELSDDALKASWDWRLTSGDFLRAESAQIDIYRSGSGRSLVFHFDPIERHVRRDGNDNRREYRQVWTFQKASKRIIRWAELF